MRLIERSEQDEKLLRDLVAVGVPPPGPQPKSYHGLVVMKGWGYEFEVFSNDACCIWLACIRAGQQVSMHCHQRKAAAFLPLTRGISLHLLSGSRDLSECISVDRGVFHSQENRTGEDAYFLEYEWPSEKTDLVRASDRYGRQRRGYEGTDQMAPFDEAIRKLRIPNNILAMMGKAA